MNHNDRADYLWCLAKSYEGYLNLRCYLFSNSKSRAHFDILLKQFEAFYDESWRRSGTSRDECKAAYESDKLTEADHE